MDELKADREPEVIRVPGSSFGRESGKVCGDLFRSTLDIATKLRYVNAFRISIPENFVLDLDSDVYEYYSERLSEAGR